MLRVTSREREPHWESCQWNLMDVHRSHPRRRGTVVPAAINRFRMPCEFPFLRLLV